MLKKYMKVVRLTYDFQGMLSRDMQSIKRREQGTIIATITLNEDGNLRNIDFDKKKPKRLYKTTERIFKNYVFPKPPENILNKQNLVKFKISVNFILK